MWLSHVIVIKKLATFRLHDGLPSLLVILLHAHERWQHSYMVESSRDILVAMVKMKYNHGCTRMSLDLQLAELHSSLYTMFVLGIINAMMNLKQFDLLGIISIETNWPGSWFAMAVLECRSLVLVSKITIIIKSICKDIIPSHCWLEQLWRRSAVALYYYLNFIIALKPLL